MKKTKFERSRPRAFSRRWMAICAVGAAAIAISTTPAQAAPFAAGDLTVYRVGSGTGSLVNTGSAVFIDEYTPAGGLVQSIAVPTTASGGNQPLIASGTGTSEGMMTLSSDGSSLVFSGYNTTLGGSANLANSAAATIHRGVGVLNVNTLSLNTTTSLSDWADANNPRAVVSTDGTNLWVGGAAGSVRYTTLGSTTSTQLSTTVTNIKGLEIANSNLYSSTGSGSAGRVGEVGTGLPTTSGQTITNLPGIPTSGSPYQFYLADLNPTVAGVDTLYLTEDTASGGLIEKFSLVSGTWTAEGTITAATVRGLTGVVSGTTVTLYGTTGSGNAGGGGSIYAFTDTTGYGAAVSGTATTIASLSGTSNEAFRGIAVIPVPEPSSVLLAAMGLVGLSISTFRRRNRRNSAR